MTRSQSVHSSPMNSSWLQTVSTLSYLTFTLVTTALACLSCAFLIVQAIRSSPSQTIENNWDVVIIGAAYVLVVRPCYLPTLHYRELTWRWCGA